MISFYSGKGKPIIGMQGIVHELHTTVSAVCMLSNSGLFFRSTTIPLNSIFIQIEITFLGVIFLAVHVPRLCRSRYFYIFTEIFALQ